MPHFSTVHDGTCSEPLGAFGPSHLSSSSNPDSLIPSRIAARMQWYESQKKSANPASCSSVTSIPNLVSSNVNALPNLSPPSGVNDGAKSSGSRPVRPEGGHQRMANLDCHGKLVKKGLLVSYGGVRAAVLKVSRGRACLGYLDYLGRSTGAVEWLRCESLQVVR